MTTSRRDEPSGAAGDARVLVAAIAEQVRHQRTRAGLSLAELARRAQISKSTLSQLEAGVGNPSVETLWALAGALGIAVSLLLEASTPAVRVVRAGEAPTMASDQAEYAVALLGATSSGMRADIYVVHADPGGARSSDPHQPGTVEHVVITHGRARVGPIDAPVVLDAGDYASYPSDAPHVFEALAPGTRAVMVSERR